jgi:hypothetical protein
MLFFTGVLIISVWGMLQNTGDIAIYLAIVIISGIMMAFAMLALVKRLGVTFPEVVGGFIPLEEIRKRNNAVANSFI